MRLRNHPELEVLEDAEGGERVPRRGEDFGLSDLVVLLKVLGVDEEGGERVPIRGEDFGLSDLVVLLKRLDMGCLADGSVA